MILNKNNNSNINYLLKKLNIYCDDKPLLSYCFSRTLYVFQIHDFPLFLRFYVIEFILLFSFRFQFFITNFICFLFLSCSSSLSSLWVLQHWKCVSYLTLLPHIRYKHQYNLYLTNLYLTLGTESIMFPWMFESCLNLAVTGKL